VKVIRPGAREDPCLDTTQSQRPVEGQHRRWRGARTRRPSRRACGESRCSGSQAFERQRVHDVLQLLLVRLRHGRGGSRRQADYARGDYDHVVNRGSLCVKGMSMFSTHASPQRLQIPRYRPPGQRSVGGHHVGRRRRSDRAEDPDATRFELDRNGTRRRRGRAGQSHRRLGVHGWRTEHQRGVLPVPESSASARARCTSSIRPGFDIAPPSPVWGHHSAGGR
jgi:hypothetical protein